MEDTRHVYAADELAEFLGIDRKTLYAAVRNGQIPHRRLGRRILFPKAAIDAWLERAPTIDVTATPSPTRFRRRKRRRPPTDVLPSDGAEHLRR